MKIMLTEQDKQEIRLACIMVDIEGTASPAVLEWMSACSELPADTEGPMPPHPSREDREEKAQ
jgi:hypothetical protein